MRASLERLPIVAARLTPGGGVVEGNARARALAGAVDPPLSGLVSSVMVRRILDAGLPAVAAGHAWSAVGTLRDGATVEVHLTADEGSEGILLTAIPAAVHDERDQLLTRLVAHTPGVGQDFFEQLVVHLSAKLGTRIAMVATFQDAARTRVETLAMCDRGALQETLIYDLEGTPCEDVTTDGPCFFPDGAAQLFPGDPMLTDLGIRSYIGVPLLDPQGEVLGLLALLHDAPLDATHNPQSFLSLFSARASTELLRKRAAEEAARQRAFVERLLDQVAALVIVVDHEGRVERFNRAVQAVLGWSEAELVGAPFTQVIPGPQDVAGLRGAPREGSWCTVTGEERLVRWQARAVDGWGEAPGHTLVTGIDLTALEQARRQRDVLQDRLRQVQRLEALGRLAGGVAHDFNNLLLAIIGYADLIQVEASDGATRDSASQIRQAADQAAGLTRQLLAFGRREHLDRRVLDLRQVIRGASGVLRPLVRPHIRLRMRLPDTPLWVLADPGRLEQVIVNLAVNARDAMPGGGDLLLDVRTDDEGPGSGSSVVLEITDTGEGIPEHVLPHIFEPFFTTKELGKGTGLGLASVYGTVQQHGGSVDVRSQPGEGTTFRIVLPRHEGPDAYPGGDSAGPAQGRARGRVLVAEDEDAVRSLVTRVLAKNGVDVDAFPDGLSAWEAFSDSPDRWDLVLADVVMPRLGGLDLARRVRGLRPDQPVLLTSGYVADVTDVPAEVRLLPKPYLAKDLMAAVERHLA